MRRYLGDINARARGLRTRLLSRADLERCARAPNLMVLQRELAGFGFPIADGPATPSALELAVRRRAAGLMHVLERWCADERHAALAVVLEDEDRRSIQAILRGAEQGISSDVRMAGLVPTATLPERALSTLTKQPTVVDVVRMLVLWNHPLGAPLVPASSGPRPSLFEIDVALQRAFAARAVARAREGGPQLVEYVEQVIDLMNVWSALLHFVERDQALVDLTFIEGGRWLSRELFAQLMGLETREAVRKRLGRAFRGSPLAVAFSSEAESLVELESAALRAQIEWQNKAVRLDPSGAAPLVGFAIELRAEVQSLRGIIWGVALRAPAALIQTEMVVA